MLTIKFLKTKTVKISFNTAAERDQASVQSGYKERSLAGTLVFLRLLLIWAPACLVPPTVGEELLSLVVLPRNAAMALPKLNNFRTCQLKIKFNHPPK